MSMWSAGIWPTASSTFTNEKWGYISFGPVHPQRAVQPEKDGQLGHWWKNENFE